ncbi:MAG: aspartate kinase, partial [Candidatus Hydrogenedentes bacterium]|nr:aspartate kinase [Candidatus Hydrogenedentota bacterium]
YLVQDGLDPEQPAQIVSDRFTELRDELGVDVDIESHIEDIKRAAQKAESPAFLMSRGEYLNALLIAGLLDATFVDPSACIRFDAQGHLDPATYALLGERLTGDGLFVVPGFYGATTDGEIQTFSRGGSDVTGSIVARASASTLYENWTDVSGIRMTDPRIVPDARRIEEITYGELRELAYMGAEVVHDEAVFPLRDSGIPMNIRNTTEPDNPGTMIVSERESAFPVCGIAARKGFTMINIEKALMNKEVGFAYRALSVLEQHRVSFEHMPSGIDTVSLIVKDEKIEQHGDAIVEDIKRVCQPDRVYLSSGLALIATVGQSMNHHVGVAARLCGALADAGVNLRVLDQGSSEMNIIVGVEDDDLEVAVTAIYNAFNNWK